MESTTKTQLKVGLFLVITVFVMLVSIFMIGGESSFFGKFMHLHAHFDQVQGLSEGSVVSLSGVNVGNIEKINFVNDLNKLDVVMKIDQRYADRVREGTQVEIRTQGALGDKYIFLIPADPKSPVVKDGAVLEVAKATDLFSVVAERGKEAERVFDILNEVHGITKAINSQGRLEKLMVSMTDASKALKEAAESTQRFTAGLDGEAGKRLRHSIERMDSVVSKIDRGEGTLGALVNDPTMHEQLKTLFGASSRRQHTRSMIRTSIEKADSK